MESPDLYNDLLLDKHLYKKSYYHFFKDAWKEIESVNLDDNWHIEYLCEELQNFYYSSDRFLILTIPPRHLKTTLVCVTYPAWIWLINPESKHISTSYSDSLILRNHEMKRNLIKSKWYRNINPINIKHGEDAKSYYTNDKKGTSYAVTVGGAITGHGADIIIIDDPHSPKMARSDVQRLQAINWYRDTLSSRLNNERTGKFILIMQRLHEEDLCGYIESQGLPFKKISLPIIAETTKKYVYPITKKVKIVQGGEILNTKRFTEQDLKNKLELMGSYNFSGQYLQRPAPAEGGTIKKSWFNFYQLSKFDYKQMKYLVQSWDLAFKETKTSDFVAGSVVGREYTKYYLVDLFVKRMGLVDSVRAIQAMHNKYFPHKCLIEDKANGTAAMEVLKRSINNMKAVEPEGGKASRLEAISPIIEAGNLYLPCINDPTEYNNTPIAERNVLMMERLNIPQPIMQLINNMASFPNCAHDDDMDSLTQALNDMRKTQSLATALDNIIVGGKNFDFD